MAVLLAKGLGTRIYYCTTSLSFATMSMRWKSATRDRGLDVALSPLRVSQIATKSVWDNRWTLPVQSGSAPHIRSRPCGAGEVTTKRGPKYHGHGAEHGKPRPGGTG